MKKQFTPLVVSLILSGMIASPLYAETTPATTQPATAATSHTVKVKKSTPVKHTKKAKKTKTTKRINTQKTEGATQTGYEAEPIHGPSTLIKQLATPSEANQALIQPEGIISPDIYVPGRSFVTTGPYIGVPLEFSGSELIVNDPSVNQDVVLLNLRKSIKQQLVKMGRSPEPDRGHLILSGMLEGQAALSRASGAGSTQSDIDLTTANLDAYLTGASSWISGFMELSHDNSIGANTGAYNSNSRTINSRVYLNKAFVMIGDFTQSPFYSSFGQMYVPFGNYGTTLISTPFTKTLGRTKARAIVLGYSEQANNALYASTYIFRGDAHASANPNHINDGGLNVGYKFKQASTSGDVGAGVIGNLADSVGMQNTGNAEPIFEGFGGTDGYGNEKLVHRVPAYDLHGSMSLLSNFNFIAEYIRAATTFSPLDMTYNGKGAKPQALDLEFYYVIPQLSRPTSVTVAYGMTKDALAIGLPKQRYSIALNTSYWKNTLQSLELHHDVDYSASATSTGSGVTGPAGDGVRSNVITAQFDVYF